MPLALAALWARGPIELRAPIAKALLAGALALAVAALVGAHWPLPRHAAAVGHAYVGSAAQGWFPGPHASVLGAAAFALLGALRNGWIGLVLLALAVLTGWARIYLGAQYPFDVLGGFALAAVVALALRPLSGAIDRGLTPRLEQWYREACRRLIAAGYFKH
jgi:undecaprenyl-diphosphatase